MSRIEPHGRGGAFVCPECLGSLPVTPETEAALLESGCVYCGAAVTREAFGLRRRE